MALSNELKSKKKQSKELNQKENVNKWDECNQKWHVHQHHKHPPPAQKNVSWADVIQWGGSNASLIYDYDIW